MPKNVNYRVKYWRWINEQAGEWYRTGLMTKDVAEKVAERLHVKKEYLLKTAYVDNDILNEAENITNKIFSYDLNDEFINSFPETNEFLALELIQKLAHQK